MNKLSVTGQIAEKWLLDKWGNPIQLLDEFIKETNWNAKIANDAFYDVWKNSKLITW